MPELTSETLVVTAHAGDFVWRAGGAIALAASRSERVTIACLTFGERGESARAWREGRSLEEIKAIRRDEAEAAAAALGAEVRFSDAGDYPLLATPQLTDQLVDLDRYGLRPLLERLGVEYVAYEDLGDR